MLDEIIILITVVSVSALFYWAFRTLPGERWQFFASYPTEKNIDGSWKGVNFTFYGFFSATGYSLASLFYIFMMSSVGVSPNDILILTSVVLGVCMPSSGWIARLVEKKKHTLTIGGASFLGIISAPWIIALLNLASHEFGFSFNVPVWPSLAALATSYCLGESVGRLACISFGCCYGKPVSEVSGPLSYLSGKLAFVFQGKTKKISYASGLDGQKVVPVQAFSAIILILAFVSGMYLFLKGSYIASLIVSLGVSQIWRAYSETLRADYRGEGNISAYQKMAVFSVIYMIVLVFFGFFGQARIVPDSLEGLKAVWNPLILIFVQAVWLASFVYSGKSSVTSVRLDYCVVEGNV